MESSKVWCGFVANNTKFRIQNLPSDRIEDAVKLFAEYFNTEESIHRVAGVHKSKDAIEEGRNLSREMITDLYTENNNSVVICCRDDEPGVVGDIVAASLMTLGNKDDSSSESDEDYRDKSEEDSKIKTKEIDKMFDIMHSLMELYDEMKELGVDSLYYDIGVVVHPNYRGLGIAKQIFNVRRRICKAEGVPLTSAWMTSLGSQKAAAQDGWQTVFEISQEEFGKKHGVIFENVPPTFKLMVGKPV